MSDFDVLMYRDTPSPLSLHSTSREHHAGDGRLQILGMQNLRWHDWQPIAGERVLKSKSGSHVPSHPRHSAIISSPSLFSRTSMSTHGNAIGKRTVSISPMGLDCTFHHLSCTFRSLRIPKKSFFSASAASTAAAAHCPLDSLTLIHRRRTSGVRPVPSLSSQLRELLILLLRRLFHTRHIPPRSHYPPRHCVNFLRLRNQSSRTKITQLALTRRTVVF